MKTALNGNLILTPYNKVKKLETSQTTTGFAMTKQKVGIDSLELLVDTHLMLSNNETKLLKKGSKVFFKEETLYTQKWPRAVMESEMFPEGFVVGHAKDVLFIEEKEG